MCIYKILRAYFRGLLFIWYWFEWYRTDVSPLFFSFIWLLHSFVALDPTFSVLLTYSNSLILFRIAERCSLSQLPWGEIYSLLQGCYWDRQPCMLMLKVNFRITNYPDMHVFGLWGDSANHLSLILSQIYSKDQTFLSFKISYICAIFK